MEKAGENRLQPRPVDPSDTHSRAAIATCRSPPALAMASTLDPNAQEFTPPISLLPTPPPPPLPPSCFLHMTSSFPCCPIQSTAVLDPWKLHHPSTPPAPILPTHHIYASLPSLRPDLALHALPFNPDRQARPSFATLISNPGFYHFARASSGSFPCLMPQLVRPDLQQQQGRHSHSLPRVQGTMDAAANGGGGHCNGGRRLGTVRFSLSHPQKSPDQAVANGSRTHGSAWFRNRKAATHSNGDGLYLQMELKAHNMGHGYGSHAWENGSRYGRTGLTPRCSPHQYMFDENEVAKLNHDHPRTTLMIRNIPNKYSQQMLLSLLDEHCTKCNQGLASDDPQSAYDFVYLPIDFRNRCNLGYAFVNFTSALATLRFYKALHDQRWEEFNSKKICQIVYARVQGRAALEEHFRNARFNCDTDEFMPLMFVPPRSGLERPPPIVVVSHVAGRFQGIAAQFCSLQIGSNCRGDERDDRCTGMRNGCEDHRRESGSCKAEHAVPLPAEGLAVEAV